MAVYGSFKYGGDKYGVDTSTNHRWGLKIDWFGTGYTGASEANLLTYVHTTRGRRDYLVKSGKGFAHNQIGRASFILENRDDRFNPFNASSPLYGYIEPGKNIQLVMKDGSAGDTYEIFTGLIEDIQAMDNNEKVQITAYDGWRYLLDREVNISVQENIRVDQAIALILDAANWPWARSLEEADTTLTYWWCAGKSAADAINELVDAEFGEVAILGDGTLEFRSRSNSEDAVYTLTQDLALKDITTPQPWDTVRNIINIKLYPKKLVEDVQLYELVDTPLIKAGDELEIFGDVTYDGRTVACKAASVQQATTHYQLWTDEEGTGTDLTAQVGITTTLFGERVKFVIANNGTTDGYLTTFKFDGDAVDTPYSSVIEVDESGTSSDKSFELDNFWLTNAVTTGYLAIYMADYLKAARVFPIVKIESRPAYQYSADLNNKITADIDKLNIDATYRIIYIEHLWASNTGQHVRTTLYTEGAPDTEVFLRFGVGQFGVSKFGY